MKKMNTLIIFCDQHNPQICGCYGNTTVHTPNLDALAARGTLFENAYTTTPICLPARASMACGDYAFRHRFWDNARPFAGDQMSWGHRLQDAGVTVTTYGKLHFKDDSEKTFPGQRFPLNAKGGLGDLMTGCRDPRVNVDNMRKVIQTAGAGNSDYLEYDRTMAKEAAKYLKEEAIGSEQPWCLYVGFVTPHYPLTAPEELLKLYEPFDQFNVADEWTDPSNLHPAVQGFKKISQMDGRISKEEIQRAIATYYALVTFMDQQVGVVLSALKEAGLEDTTRIVYMNDHGDTVGEHGVFFKHTMYEGSVRIPMIVAGPDIPQEKRIAEPTSIIDLYPTLLDFYNLEATDEEIALPGISMMKTINEGGDANRCIFSEYNCVGFLNSVFMLRKGDYKLVKYAEDDRCSLFNLKADPDEKKDLGQDETYSAIVADLLKELKKICDPEEVNRASHADQDKLMQEYGGVEAIMRRGATTYSPVPNGMGTKQEK